MRYKKSAMGTAAVLAVALTGTVFATGASAWVNPLKNRYIDETYSICDQGGFFVGGVPKVTNFASSAITEGQPEQLIIGQAYVQFQIPKERLKWPLIMVHGSGYTGSALDATPDGREGWFPTRCATASRPSSSTSPAAAAPASTSRSSTRRECRTI